MSLDVYWQTLFMLSMLHNVIEHKSIHNTGSQHPLIQSTTHKPDVDVLVFSEMEINLNNNNTSNLYHG